MTYLQNNFVVFGPSGRCGSHWVETLLKNLVGVTHTVGPLTLLPTGWIYHTNGKADLLEMPSEIKNSATLVHCVRKNHFDVVISFLVAEITDEWHSYTSKTVEPFVVDTVRFQTLINDLHYYQTKEVPEDILPLFNNLITIDFDNLISSAIPEKYVADQLGIDYDVNKNYQQPDSNPSNKNTRNYKELILNWNELVDIYKVFSPDYHTQ
jgi:hypothetical protein